MLSFSASLLQQDFPIDCEGERGLGDWDNTIAPKFDFVSFPNHQFNISTNYYYWDPVSNNNNNSNDYNNNNNINDNNRIKSYGKIVYI